MKFSTLAVAATLVLASGSALAKNVVFKPVNDNFETQVCLTAATEGLAAAKTLVSSNDMNYVSFSRTVTCNDQSIAEFANSHATQEASSGKATRIALKAKNTNVESQLCLDAVVIGEDAARAKYDVYGEVLCNRRSLSSFVSRYADQEVELRTTED